MKQLQPVGGAAAQVGPNMPWTWEPEVKAGVFSILGWVGTVGPCSQRGPSVQHGATCGCFAAAWHQIGPGEDTTWGTSLKQSFIGSKFHRFLRTLGIINTLGNRNAAKKQVELQQLGYLLGMPPKNVSLQKTGFFKSITLPGLMPYPMNMKKMSQALCPERGRKRSFWPCWLRNQLWDSQRQGKSILFHSQVSLKGGSFAVSKQNAKKQVRHSNRASFAESRGYSSMHII